MIYFILNSNTNTVKIGHTKQDVNKRLTNLQSANSEPLVLLKTIDGDVNFEKELHLRFKKYKKIGEWFIFSDELKTYIDYDENKTYQISDNLLEDVCERRLRFQAEVSEVELNLTFIKLININIVETKELLTDYLRIRSCKSLRNMNLKAGDIIQFNAMVDSYVPLCSVKPIYKARYKLKNLSRCVKIDEKN